MSVLLPGVLGGRVARRSELIFGWHADDCSLDARSGQSGSLLQNGTPTLLSGGPLAPAYGPLILAGGKRQPRFGRSIAGLNKLNLCGSCAGLDVEQFIFPNFTMFAQDYTVMLKFTGNWVMGSSRASENWVFGLGLNSTDAGRMWISRGGATPTSWRAGRVCGSNSAVGTLVENSAWTWPLIVCVQHFKSDYHLSMTIEAANGATGTQVSAAIAVAGVRFSGDIMGVGCDSLSFDPGPSMELFEAKIAAGIMPIAIMKELGWQT